MATVQINPSSEAFPRLLAHVDTALHSQQLLRLRERFSSLYLDTYLTLAGAAADDESARTLLALNQTMMRDFREAFRAAGLKHPRHSEIAELNQSLENALYWCERRDRQRTAEFIQAAQNASVRLFER